MKAAHDFASPSIPREGHLRLQAIHTSKSFDAAGWEAYACLSTSLEYAIVGPRHEPTSCMPILESFTEYILGTPGARR